MSSHAASTQNLEFRSLSGVGLPAQSNTREFGGLFPPPGIDASRSPSVRVVFPLCLVRYIGQQLSIQQHDPQLSQPNQHEDIFSHMNVPFKEYLKMRSERDHWNAKYRELK